MQTLSIVIPVLNEAEGLQPLLAGLEPYQERGCELIFVDGGSQDATPERLQSAGWTTLVSPRGRAQQMNTGAQHASGALLLFLHADTRLPLNADRLLAEALARKPQAQWGRFDVRIEGASPMLRVIAFFMNARSRLSGIATGDQAMFIRKSTFTAVGGFPNIALMEDIALSKRMKAWGPPLCLRTPVVTSGRRWMEHGVWKTIFLMWRLRWQYWLGADPNTLARHYRAQGEH